MTAELPPPDTPEGFRLRLWLRIGLDAGQARAFDDVLCEAADAHPQGRASLWPRLEVAVRDDGGAVLRVASLSPPREVASLQGVEWAAEFDAPDPEVWPSVEALLAGRGTPAESAEAALLRQGASSVQRRAVAWWLAHTPFECLARVDGGPVAHVRPSPVRKGRGGAAIWWEGEGGTGRFVPLVLEFEAARGPSTPPVHFSLWPRDPRRRAFARIGPYDLFHGDPWKATHGFLMRVAQMTNRAIVAARYDAARIPEALRREAGTMRSVVLRGGPSWVPAPLATRHDA